MPATLVPLHLPHAPVVDDIGRRELLGAMAALGALAACGPGGQRAARGATKPFEHAGGTTDVPVSPTRVVSLGSSYVTWQLATLGVLSVGTSAAPLDDPNAYIRLVDPDAATALDGLVSVGDGDVDLEAVARLRPDLIVGCDFQADLYDRLSRIAPTVLLAADLPTERYFGVQGALADLTGITARLEARHAAYDERVRRLRERHADRWAELDWLVLDDYETGGGAFLVNLTRDTPGHRVLTDLGAPLAPPARRLADGESYVELAPEAVTDLDADVIFVAPPFATLVEDPDAPVADDVLGLVSASAASGADQVLPVGLAWTNSNVASLDIVLDDVERFLASRPDPFFATPYSPA